MKPKTYKALALAVLANLLPPSWPAAAGDIELHADLQNLFIIRNDSDFDRTAPKYDQSGQTVGAFATVFKPYATWRITDNLRLYYELEIGLNFWSKQNPDEQNPLATDVFVMKHREIWGAGDFFDKALGFKVGYGRTMDTTGLFLNHWIGKAEFWWSWSDRERLTFMLGQIPDQTYEGINMLDNNFKRDIFISGVVVDTELADDLRLSSAVHYLYDDHLVGQTRWLLCPNLHLEFKDESWLAFVDAILQAGEFEGQALGGGYARSLAWAAQGHLEWKPDPLTLAFNVLALSPDDAYPGNRTNYAFLYSAKTRSSTLMLTEDKIRDWYDNLDERMSTYGGGLFLNRAGLLVADLKAAWKITDWFTPALIVGAASVLKPENALNNTFVGLETDLLLRFDVTEAMVVQVAFGSLVPGGAGAALINRIDLKATDPIFMAEASVMLHY